MQRTSISDISSYRSICEAAANNGRVFRCFRREAAYREILEHVTYEQGIQYLQITMQQTPQIADLARAFARNDEVGGPKRYRYKGFGRLSPTTCRYVKVLSDLIFHFGDLNGLRLVEIGAGYGGQCGVVHSYCKPDSYTIIDLPEAIGLQCRFLRALGIAGAQFIASESVTSTPEAKYDLCVSNYAISECRRDVQELYLSRIINNARHGYLTLNFLDNQGVDLRCLTLNEWVHRIPGSRLFEERPKTYANNVILVW